MEIRFENEVYDLEIRGLRKALHEDVDEVFDNIDEPTEEDYEDLELVHNLISQKDINALLDDCFCDNITFEKVESDDLLKEALQIAGYKVEESFASRSLYVINDNGQEVRISDHKRPAVEQNGIYTDHEYENEIIVQDNIVKLNTLKENGISKLNKREFILG